MHEIAIMNCLYWLLIISSMSFWGQFLFIFFSHYDSYFPAPLHGRYFLLDTSIANSTLLHTEHFGIFIPMNILEFCFEFQLSYLGSV